MSLTLRDALDILDAGLAHAAERRLNISIAIVDSGGYLVAAGRSDEAPALSAEIALGKAAAAALFRSPSGDLAQRWGPGGAIPTAVAVRLGGRFIPHQGGVPIRHGDEVVGGVGVSGAPSHVDEDVARAALGALGARGNSS